MQVVTKSWLHSRLIFCSCHDIFIHDPLPSFSPQRKGDKALLLLFLEQGAKHENLKMLQQCCMHANLVSLADAVSLDGTHLCPCLRSKDTIVYQCNKSNSTARIFPVSALNWPMFLQHLDKTARQNGILNTPLGEWTQANLNKWIWYYSPSDQQIYKRHAHYWKVYCPHHQTP